MMTRQRNCTSFLSSAEMRSYAAIVSSHQAVYRGMPLSL
jgi:hypothetical protein